MTTPEAPIDAARAAYRRAVAALDDLAAALVAAGILTTADVDAEESARVAARERQRARRARLAGYSSSVVTPATVTGNDPPPARARVPYREELITTPDIAPQYPHPLAVTPPAVAPAAPAPVTVAPVAAPPATAQERPALPLQATNGPPAVSAPPPAPAGPVKRGPGRPRKNPAPVTPENVTSDPGDPGDPVATVWAAYQAAAGSRAILTPARRQLIRRRLSEGFTAEQLARACAGYARSPWHRGENPNGRPYKAAELWFRDAAHVEQGLTLADAPLRPTAPPGTRPPLSGIAAAWDAETDDSGDPDALDVIGAALDGP